MSNRLLARTTVDIAPRSAFTFNHHAANRLCDHPTNRGVVASQEAHRFAVQSLRRTKEGGGGCARVLCFRQRELSSPQIISSVPNCLVDPLAACRISGDVFHEVPFVNRIYS